MSLTGEMNSSETHVNNLQLHKNRFGLQLCAKDEDLITCEESMSCQQQAYVLTGYRPPNKSALYYVKSVFQLNNETLNFWTHFIPLLHFLYSYYHFFNDFEHSKESFCLPYYAHGLGCCILLAASSMAHMFWSHSESVSHHCCSVDRACIFTYAFSIRVGFEHYLCPMNHFCDWPFSATSSLMIFSAFWTFSFVVVIFIQDYVPILGKIIMVGANLVGGFLGFYACFLRYHFDFSSDPMHVTFHIGHGFGQTADIAALTLLLGALIYSLRIPERFAPGKFDTVGLSHQWMHICTAASMYAQSIIFRQNVDEISEKLDSGKLNETDVGFSFVDTVGAVVITAVLTNFAIVLHWYLVRRNNTKQKSN